MARSRRPDVSTLGRREAYVSVAKSANVPRDRIVQGLTVAFGGMSLALVLVGVATNPALLVLAAVFAVVAGILYYQASGRLARRVYRRVERQAAVDGGTRAGRGGFGAGPRAEWRGPRRGPRDGRGRGPGPRRSEQRNEPSDRKAYATLGLEPGAPQTAVRDAYRDRIKEVHPDAEGGDEAAFREVQEAYEVLSE
jgi:hypothetical protein